VPAPAPKPRPAPTPAPQPRPRRTFVDDFKREIATEKWIIGLLLHPPMALDRQVRLSQTSGGLEITPRQRVDGAHFNGIISRERFDTSNAALVVRALEVPREGATTTIGVAKDISNWYGFVASGAELHCLSTVAGKRTATSVRYDAKSQRFWRLRMKDGVVTWETSANGGAWKQQRRMSSAPPLGPAAALIEAGTDRLVRSPGVAVFDRITMTTR
jgi:hypothetical protein